MKVIPLLGQHLKGAAVRELLAGEDGAVWYDFDRSGGNRPDVYWAEFKGRGYLLRFDAEQRLDLVRLYVAPDEGYDALLRDVLEDVPLPRCLERARELAATWQEKLTEGDAPKGLGRLVRWAKVEHGGVAYHFEYRDDVLDRVTISRAKN